MIPYGRQEITDEDIDEVVKVLHSDFLTQGPTVPKFEKLVSENNLRQFYEVNDFVNCPTGAKRTANSKSNKTSKTSSIKIIGRAFDGLRNKPPNAR